MKFLARLREKLFGSPVMHLQDRDDQWWIDREELDRLDWHEEITARKMARDNPNLYLREILAIRDKKVAVLERLGWKLAAAELRKDNEMRRGWIDGV